MWMNHSEVMNAAWRYENDPILGPATLFLREFMEQVNENSDGWAYWQAPVKAAEKLMVLIQRGLPGNEADFKKTLAPIKSFYTRKGYKAGMIWPVVHIHGKKL